jgi:hypothetical protein
MVFKKLHKKLKSKSKKTNPKRSYKSFFIILGISIVITAFLVLAQSTRTTVETQAGMYSQRVAQTAVAMLSLPVVPTYACLGGGNCVPSPTQAAATIIPTFTPAPTVAGADQNGGGGGQPDPIQNYPDNYIQYLFQIVARAVQLAF